MPTLSNATVLTYANLQLAAEALLDDPEPYLDQLTTGNNRTSRFTEVDYLQTLSRWFAYSTSGAWSGTWIGPINAQIEIAASSGESMVTWKDAS